MKKTHMEIQELRDILYWGRWTQKRAADECGVSHRCLAYYLAGERLISQTMAATIRDRLGRTDERLKLKKAS